MITITHDLNKSGSPHKDHLKMVVKPFDTAVFVKTQQMTGYKRWMADRTLVFRNTGANIRWMNSNYPEAEWDATCKQYLDDVMAIESSGERVAQLKQLAVLEGDDDYRYAREPMAHQRKGFLLTRDERVFALLMEQGTGKTKIIIDTACHLHNTGKIDALVVVAWPNGVHRNWVEYELPEDMPEDSDYQAMYWKSGAGVGYMRELDKLNSVPSDALKIVTINIEAFASTKAKDYLTSFLENNRTLFCIDQSASIKNPAAKRTQFLIDEASSLAPYRRILDGDPVAEGAGELYSQMRFLDENIIGHDTWTAFKAEFCEVGRFNNVIGLKNLDELHRRIDGYCYRVLEKDVLDLPPRIYNKWSFELGREEKRIFKELATEALTEFNGIELELDSPLTKNMRLQQVSCGWFPTGDEDEPLISIGENSRIEALKQLLLQLEGSVIIYSRFRADVDAIHDQIENVVKYYGGMTDDEKGSNKQKFIAGFPEARIIAATTKSLGVGHTLTQASHIIFYSNDHSLRMRIEGEKRAHRKGQDKHLKVWDLMAKGTQDARIRRALRDKREVSEVIMQDPHSFFLAD